MNPNQEKVAMGEESTPKDNRPVILWDCDPHAEQLNHNDKDAAIEVALDSGDRWDGTIIVYGYARVIVPKPSDTHVENLLDDFFDGNWEEYIGEDGPDITDRMREAAQQFLTVLHEEFTPWPCEQVTSEEVDIAEWIAEKHPNWLKERFPVQEGE